MSFNLEAVQQARRNIAQIALRTPLVKLNADGQVFLKLENLQPIGSFKIRGAANAMGNAGREKIARGVLTASAGNMAQGVAYCAGRMGVAATVVTPETAPETKLKAVQRLGGRIIKVPFDTWWRTFEERAFPGVDATFIHAFDDADVQAGNGTIGLELLEDLPDLESVVVPWGGGGLCCGIAAVVKALRPSVRVYAVECETGAPLSAALAAGQPVTVQEAAEAMRFVAERNRVICEGAAACAVAAARRIDGKVVAIVSGGNIDLQKFAEIAGG
jgi:threonine dehydratase